MHGAHDESGTVVEAGWLACGLEHTLECPEERTWAYLARP